MTSRYQLVNYAATNQRICVTGGRDFLDSQAVRAVLGLLDPICVGVGDCPSGVDASVLSWVREAGLHCVVYKALWTTHHQAAGPRRNRQMLEEFQPDVLIAFPGGKGTSNCVREAVRLGIPVFYPMANLERRE